MTDDELARRLAGVRIGADLETLCWESAKMIRGQAKTIERLAGAKEKWMKQCNLAMSQLEEERTTSTGLRFLAHGWHRLARKRKKPVKKYVSTRKS